MTAKNKLVGSRGGPARRSDDTYQQIMMRIHEDQLAPGSRLPAERELAEQLGVSRATLRDALNRLEARGLIERRTGSGNYVCTVLPDSVRSPIEDGLRHKLVTMQQIVDVRKPLEVWAAQEAARRRTKDQLADLQAAVTKMQTAGKRKAASGDKQYRQADIQFHLTIAKMTENPVYLHLLQFLTETIQKSLTISREIMYDAFLRDNTARHEAILASIAESNPTAAAQAMIDHFAFLEKHRSVISTNRP